MAQISKLRAEQREADQKHEELVKVALILGIDYKDSKMSGDHEQQPPQSKRESTRSPEKSGAKTSTSYTKVELLILLQERFMHLIGFFIVKYYSVFKSCRKDCIYKLNALERHHKVVNASGKLCIFFEPRSLSWGVSVRNKAGYHNCYILCNSIICNNNVYCGS